MAEKGASIPRVYFCEGFEAVINGSKGMTGSRLASLCLFGLAAVAGLVADLGSKSAVFHWLGYPSEDPLVVIPNLLQFVTRLNQGGIWSIGADYGVKMNTLLAVFSSVAAVLIVIWGYFGVRSGERFFPIVLGAILAGALGNLHDRLFYQGVRDFIEVHYYDLWYFPTFNLADSCLVCGAACLVLSSLLGVPLPHRHRTAPKPVA